jgi:hypothetical protein
VLELQAHLNCGQLVVRDSDGNLPFDKQDSNGASVSW